MEKGNLQKEGLSNRNTKNYGEVTEREAWERNCKTVATEMFFFSSHLSTHCLYHVAMKTVPLSFLPQYWRCEKLSIDLLNIDLNVNWIFQHCLKN